VVAKRPRLPRIPAVPGQRSAVLQARSDQPLL